MAANNTPNQIAGLWDRLLYLEFNQISDLSGLAGLTKLEQLVLWGNQISDLSPLSGLSSLTHLFLSENQIRDVGPLVDNQGLAEQDFVALRSNPLSEESLNIHIPQLESRGVTVDYDTPP